MTLPKIKVLNPLVELDGDELTRVIWQDIKTRFIHPYLTIDLKYYDLGLPNRNATSNKVVHDAGQAIKKYSVGVKCATISVDPTRVQEYNLKAAWPSPNIALRAVIGGTIFREPVIIPSIPRYVQGWKKPIIIGRHAFGDHTRAKERVMHTAGKLEMIFTPKGGKPETVEVVDFDDDGGVGLTMYNTKTSITDFAHSCFKYALSKRLPLFLSTKNTVLKAYDGVFVEIFENLYEGYRASFEEAGLCHDLFTPDLMNSLTRIYDGKLILTEIMLLPIYSSNNPSNLFSTASI